MTTRSFNVGSTLVVSYQEGNRTGTRIRKGSTYSISLYEGGRIVLTKNEIGMSEANTIIRRFVNGETKPK